MLKKKILLGISGGIAAVKAPLLVREFIKSNFEVKIAITNAAKEFVTPYSLSVLSQNEVVTNIFEFKNSKASTWHINLAEWCDIMLIAPATADLIAKIVNGIADDPVSILVLSLRAPLIICPSMDKEMWLNKSVQQNISILKERGYFILPPNEGELASGLYGIGRLPEIYEIKQFVEKVLSKNHQDFKNKNILVTAGPTYEKIDAVRFIGNFSSGKMGFAIANAFALRGGNVNLVSGPVKLDTPKNINRIDITSANEMFEHVKKNYRNSDIIVMCAAVSDFTPNKKFHNKFKKGNLHSNILSIELKQTKDILKFLGEKKGKKILVGFALETENLIQNGRKKLKEKKLDMIVCNKLGKNSGFNSDTNKIVILDKFGNEKKIGTLSKFDTANEILDYISKNFLHWIV